MSNRPAANATLHRQWLVLQMLRPSPQKIDGATIEARLRDAGIKTTRRTIQRDLESLSAIFPLHCDEKHKPYGWAWAKGAETVHLPGMDARTALAFALVEKHLPTALPRAATRYLDGHFKNAREVLTLLRGRAFGAWLGRVHVVGSGMKRQAPKVDERVVDVVYEALLADRCFSATYTKRGDEAPRAYVVSPLGLVLKDAVVYLVCTLNAHDDAVLLVLHRMKSAKLLDEPRRVPAGFDLDAYVAKGAVHFLLSDEDVALSAAFDPGAAATLLEAPLSADQRITPLPDGRIRVDATVGDTSQLRAWLLSYGPLVEVLGPPALRAAVGDAAMRAAARYAA